MVGAILKDLTLSTGFCRIHRSRDGRQYLRASRPANRLTAKAITFIEDAPLFSTADALFSVTGRCRNSGADEHALGKKRGVSKCSPYRRAGTRDRFFWGHALLPICNRRPVQRCRNSEHFEIGQQAYHYFLGAYGSFNRDVFCSRWILARGRSCRSGRRIIFGISCSVVHWSY